jgi:hypothetical protein
MVSGVFIGLGPENAAGSGTGVVFGRQWRNYGLVNTIENINEIITSELAVIQPDLTF